MKNNAAEEYWLDEMLYEYEEIPETELKALDNFLRTKSLPGGCSSLMMFDGFAAGIVAGGVFTPYDNKLGMSVVWGQTRKTMKGEATKLELKMAAIIYHHIKNIFSVIQMERHSYNPMLKYCGDPERPDYVEWCRGFMKAFNMAPQGWAPIFTSKASRSLIAPFIYFGTESGWGREAEFSCDSSELGGKFSYNIEILVFAIADYFYPSVYLDVANEFLKDASPHWKMPINAGEVKR